MDRLQHACPATPPPCHCDRIYVLAVLVSVGLNDAASFRRRGTYKYTKQFVRFARRRMWELTWYGIIICTGQLKLLKTIDA